MIEYEQLSKVNASFIEEFQSSCVNFLSKGWYILGEHVDMFEKEFASYIQHDYCIGVASGLDALSLSLRSLNLNIGDEIIVPANTYIATILAVLHCGLKPILVEPDLGTYNIDSSKIEEKISDKTRAILVVHLYGKSADMNPIIRIKEKYNLLLVEDCAQSHGAKYYNKMTGTFGDLGAFSFYPTKNLGALGDAGAIVTKNKEYYNTLLKLRNYGSQEKYYNDLIGYNSRLDEIQALFLSIKLKKLDFINRKKRKLAKLYFQYLKDDFIKPILNKNYFDVFHIFNIRHPWRDRLKEYLLRNGIKTEIHYPVPPNKQNALRNMFINERFPISEEIHSTTLSLPISFSHTEEEITSVIKIMNKF